MRRSVFLCCITAGFAMKSAAAACAAGLTVMLAEPPRSMDPADQNATATHSILAPFYESLVQQDETGSIRPGLATRWSGSVDGRVWRFTLRPHVLFHDGAPCDPEAVAASLKRLIDPKAGLAGAGVFRGLIMDVAEDGQDVVITLARPYADILHLLAMTQAAVVSPIAARGGTLGRHADGTGPFRFGDWQDGDHVRALRFDRYWGAAPSLDWINWTWSPEPSVVNMALQTGDANVVMPISPVFADLYTPGRPASAEAVVYRAPGSALFWAALNTRLPPLNDPRVRRALSLSIDRRALVAGLLHGNGQPACFAITPETPGARGCGAAAGADIDQARTLLEQAGWHKGFSITAVVQEPEEPIAEALQAMWRSIGVRLVIRRQEAGVWVQSAFAPPDEKKRSETGVIISSWSAPFVADLQIRPLYAAASAAPAGANLGFYDNPIVDAEIEAAAGTLDPIGRAALYGTIQTRLADDAPMLPLYVQDDLFGVRRDIEGVTSLPDGEIVVTQAHRRPVR
ncbi:ABC transporter substrate-binding protein [Tanticharoenia sakaeratensis]|nr:ABC transporter substrate-binding protein [Tanticharoenia sakaeratensis]